MKNNIRISNKDNIKIITRSGLLIALSFVGAMIKIQGSIAFDSMAGYFAALFINPVAGATVAFLGHILTSVTSGLPLTLPLHLVIALQMAVCAYVFGIIGRRTNGIIASIVAILLNGPVATYITSIVAGMIGLAFSGIPMFKALVLPLTIAAGANIILAYIIFQIINKRKAR